VGAVSSQGDSPRYTKGDEMFGRLVQWLVTVLVVLVAGIVIGLVIEIVIADIPLAVLVVAVMVGAIALFLFVVWAVKGSG